MKEAPFPQHVLTPPYLLKGEDRLLNSSACTVAGHFIDEKTLDTILKILPS